jgi:hypothetical protein
MTGLLPKKQQQYDRFVATIERVLPHLEDDDRKVVSTLILLALKLEGIVGKTLSEDDLKLVHALHDMVMKDDDQREAALNIIHNMKRKTA